MKLAPAVGTLAFIACVVASIAGHPSWVTRFVGISCVASGFAWMKSRSIPVGIEDKPPSFFITGTAALMLGLAMATLGLVIIVFAARATCLLGWAGEAACV